MNHLAFVEGLVTYGHLGEERNLHDHDAVVNHLWDGDEAKGSYDGVWGD
jgi:hypothetical protein